MDNTTNQPDIPRPYEDNSAEDIEPDTPKSKPINVLDNHNQENCSIKLRDGFEISLTSSTLQCNQLCDISLMMIKELNNNDKKKQQDYLG